MDYTQNPFPKDNDRKAIWEMLVSRDIDAFLNQDFSVVASDFLKENFCGIHAQSSFSPDSWQLRFPSLNTYKEEWLRQAKDFATTRFAEDPRIALFKATNLRDIEIVQDIALLRKKFHGSIRTESGRDILLNWQTAYTCKKVKEQWRILGFIGYLPYPNFSNFENTTQEAPSSHRSFQKTLPRGASQHVSAGPYSPVLEVSGDKLVVISGQAPLDMQGIVQGDSIEEQSKLTLENCRKQLHTAKIGFENVFKVNVYLSDISQWSKFNKIYEQTMPAPYPARTAIECVLLPGFLVEIDMWAMK